MTKHEELFESLSTGWSSVPDLCAKFGWLPHTLRAAISTVSKKYDLKVERRRVDGVTSYRFFQAETKAAE